MTQPEGVGTPSASGAAMRARLERLEAHLAVENPAMLDIVKSFRQLDKVAYRLGLLERSQSFASLVPWWPLISVVGTFSSGKSTFINQYLGAKVQRTGNQAVDDKFTVLCYSTEANERTLPGLALDADPRFPLYRISRELEQVETGEGARVDSYLQLRTSPSPQLKGKILIDSPGFDADEQRTSVLRIIEHILGLSDLVLVLFDARHPEPGAMQDTLEHLVANTMNRADAGKFLYILNQVDNTAREDNPEEVFAAWQRALAQKGLTAGRFYRIYDPDSAIDLGDSQVRERFESKRAEDMAEIMTRIDQVEVARMYRVIGVLEEIARSIENELIPQLRGLKARWKKQVLWSQAVVFGGLALGALVLSIWGGAWEGLRFTPDWFATVSASRWLSGLALGALVAAVAYLHFSIRSITAKRIRRAIVADESLKERRFWLARAFTKNTRPWRPFLLANPAGWTLFTRRRLERIFADADRLVQALNNRFARPSGVAQSDQTDTTGPAHEGSPDAQPSTPTSVPANAR